MSAGRDKGGRFRPGIPSPNPKGRPKKARGVDAALLGALSEKVTVTEQGRRRRRSKLEITAAQIANKSAGGDMRAAKMAFEMSQKAEGREQTSAVLAPVMTESDHEIAGRVIARLRLLIAEGGNDENTDA